MKTRHFDIYAPLQEFVWEGGDFEIAPGIFIKRFQSTPDLAGLDEWVAKDEWERALAADHWLTFHWIDGEAPSPSDIINLVLFSLWLVKPIRSQIALQFQIGRDSASKENSRKRHLDRFAWVPGTIDPDIEVPELELASSYYAGATSLYIDQGRLSDALLLTISGCWSHAWQTALICYSAAAETILTCATGPGITRRLATSYACITESEKSKRDSAFKEFVDLYSARSDIMHGRTYNVSTADRLPFLTRFQVLLRKLWKTVILSDKHLAALEGDDDQRKSHLRALESGYSPP